MQRRQSRTEYTRLLPAARMCGEVAGSVWWPHRTCARDALIRNPSARVPYTPTMKRVTLFALALLFCSTLASANDGKRGVSISFNSDDPNTLVGPRRNVREAKLAI